MHIKCVLFICIKMKKIGIITFHAAYNYGSLLQNYALQQTLLKIGFEPETINLRTNQQKEQYNYFTPWAQLLDKRRLILSIAFFPFKNALRKKYQLFEHFLKDDLRLTHEVKEGSEIKKLSLYDAYISGSDQIWNLYAKDFNWSYFLDFVPDGIPCISYAASMGPNPSAILKTDKEILNKVQHYLARYTAISVREERTASIIKTLCPQTECEVLIDPTLLLDSKEWKTHIFENPMQNKPYIFLYNPYYLKDVYKQAEELSRITGLKVVVSNINMESLFFYPYFSRCLEAGPWEFLNLIQHADYVIGRSFHLLVFSILFEKHFIAVEGMDDSRLANLLNLTGLQKLATHDNNIKQVIQNFTDMDFSFAHAALAKERKKAIDFLFRELL